MVHVANMPSFLGRTIYFSPVDGKNLNRVYPGRADGTVSERIAYAITHEIIDRADYVLDLHCGDGNEWLRPYVYQTVTADERLNQEIARLALAFGIDHIVIDRNRPTDPAHSMYCSNTAITRGKPAMTVESGYLGTCDPECIAQIAAGVRGVMRELKMTAEGPAPLADAVYLDPTEVLTSPETGIIYPHVRRGEQGREGAIVRNRHGFFRRCDCESVLAAGGSGLIRCGYAADCQRAAGGLRGFAARRVDRGRLTPGRLTPDFEAIFRQLQADLREPGRRHQYSLRR